MARLVKRTAILAALETTSGTAVTPAATDALVISDASFSVEYNNVERSLLRPTLGHSGTLVGSRHVKIDFTCELFASGAVGIAPPWGKLLQACAMAEVVTMFSRVEYTPVSTGFKSLTIHYHMDGVTHIAVGCMGTVELSEQDGERPTLKFSFVGTDGGISAANMPGQTLSAWKAPEVVNGFNSGRLTLGGTYSAGAITGGVAYCSRGLSLNLANDAKFIQLLGCSGADITDRKPTGKFEIEVSAAQEVTMRGEINANTPTSLSLLHGSAAGKRVLVHVPQALRLNPQYSDYEGTALLACDFNAEPVTGNDELRIVCL